MSARDPGRPQDQARPHRRTRGTPAPETEALLEEYRAAMRLELRDTLHELRPTLGQLDMNGKVTRPPLELRRELWDFAIRLGRELTSSAELGWSGAPPTTTTPKPARAPRLSARARQSLGG